jgi:hypothetical protein
MFIENVESGMFSTSNDLINRFLMIVL